MLVHQLDMMGGYVAFWTCAIYLHLLHSLGACKKTEVRSFQLHTVFQGF